MSSSGEEAATATPSSAFVPDFRYTNGLSPIRSPVRWISRRDSPHDDSPRDTPPDWFCSIDVNGVAQARDVIETYKGLIQVSPTLCWCEASSTTYHRRCAFSRASSSDASYYATHVSISARYLDSRFCARFHALKKLGDPVVVQQVGSPPCGRVIGYDLCMKSLANMPPPLLLPIAAILFRWASLYSSQYGWRR